MNTNQQLEEELKHLIVETLKLEDIEPGEIEADTPLFNGGLELDSIDALEIGLAIQSKYGLKFKAQSEEVQRSFSCVRSLAEFIRTSQLANSSAEQPA